MKFHSTQNNTKSYSLSEALVSGLAPDGGLFIPESLPRFNLAELTFESWPQFAATILAPFFAEDQLESQLSACCRRAFNFPVPVRTLGENQPRVLELFHGPTAAFKDFGARFLAASLSHLTAASNPSAQSESRPRLVLVATSGDTGGAVAAAFAESREVTTAILYPKGQVSPLQEQQLTCWPDNVQAYAVEGTFDDCQALVKKAFGDVEWKKDWQMISANSINIGRLLPQSVYFAGASFNHYVTTKEKLDVVVPTGNLGNALAAIWAKEMGFPIARIAFALNANRPLYHYMQTGEWRPLASISTLANAMDVGSASNFERLRSMFPNYFQNDFAAAVSASDDEIASTIQYVHREFDYVICPHTATGFFAAQKLGWRSPLIAATAHPAKFREVVEPLIGQKLTLPDSLRQLNERGSRKKVVKPDLVQIASDLVAGRKR